MVDDLIIISLENSFWKNSTACVRCAWLLRTMYRMACIKMKEEGGIKKILTDFSICEVVSSVEEVLCKARKLALNVQTSALQIRHQCYQSWSFISYWSVLKWFCSISFHFSKLCIRWPMEHCYVRRKRRCLDTNHHVYYARLRRIGLYVHVV